MKTFKTIKKDRFPKSFFGVHNYGSLEYETLNYLYEYANNILSRVDYYKFIAEEASRNTNYNGEKIIEIGYDFYSFPSMIREIKSRNPQRVSQLSYDVKNIFTSCVRNMSVHEPEIDEDCVEEILNYMVDFINYVDDEFLKKLYNAKSDADEYIGIIDRSGKVSIS